MNFQVGCVRIIFQTDWLGLLHSKYKQWRMGKNPTDKNPVDENPTDKNPQLPNSDKKTHILLFHYLIYYLILMI